MWRFTGGLAQRPGALGGNIRRDEPFGHCSILLLFGHGRDWRTISGSIAHTCARLGRDGCVWISSKLSKATSLSSYSVDLVTRNEMGDMAQDDDNIMQVEDEPDEQETLVDGVTIGGQLYANSQISTTFFRAVSFLSQYGWYALLALVVLVVAWVNLRPYFYAWKKRRDEWVDEQNFDPVRAEKYQDELLRAREKMQKAQDEKAAVYKEKTDEKEEEERNERIKQWETFGVVTNTKSKSSKPKGDDGSTSSRRDHFPLSGSGGGGGYRPARRNVGRGG